MFSLFAVAKQTFQQSLRMKIAGLFILFLVAVLVLLPLNMRGDETLTGRIQTFLSYSVSLTAALLSLVTIFVSTGVVTSDIRYRQIFSLVTKPVSRWKYIVGRWLGIVFLNLFLLVFAGVAIYFEAQYLRNGQPLDSNDRRRVETEIFTARSRISPEPINLEKAVNDRIAELKEKGLWEGALQSSIDEFKGNQQAGEKRLLEHIQSDRAAKLQSAGPGQTLNWDFKGIRVSGQEISTQAEVVAVDLGRRLVQLKPPSRLLGHIVYSAPIRVNGVEGRAVGLSKDYLLVEFSAEDMTHGSITSLKPEKDVPILIEPMIQITFKAEPADIPPDRMLDSIWQVLNPQTRDMFQEARKDAARLPATVVVPARVVSPDGRTQVRYINIPEERSQTSVTILQDDIAVLFQVGGFEANFIRGMALLLIQVMFLAALGVLMGSQLSFPVACLVCFSMLPFQMAREFLLESTNPMPSPSANPGILDYANYYLVQSVNAVLPDFSRTSPVESFVDGMNISWSYLGETVFWVLGVQTAILLAVACVLFSKRELARVQV